MLRNADAVATLAVKDLAVAARFGPASPARTKPRS
jgi:hypothetical protein